MKRLLALAALAEAATGAALVAVPSLVGQLLLAAELTGVAAVVARIFGIGLLSLGIACWPGKTPAAAAVAGMLTYSALVTLYLSYLGVRGEWVGPLLWPAVALHAILTFLLTIGGVGLWRRTSAADTM
ncbi:MAG: hypothetical protein L0219_02480 [Phycisphaerales bacterium]|nr:hypothetical protein [Phycisphaerales bacterium]MCI0674427.1 hypothetical protein [Phycisphaerales bacterium]